MAKDKNTKIDAEKTKIKAEKKEKRKSELKSFFILFLIIAVICGSVYYWYTHIYEEKEPTKKTQENTTTNTTIASSYTAENSLNLVGGKYLIDQNDKSDSIKVVNLEGKVIYEGEIEFSYIYTDENGNLYVILDEYAENENVVTIYKLEDGEFKEYKEFGETNVYYTPILYSKDDNSYLMGFYGMNSTSSDDKKNKLYLLGKETIELDNINLVGDETVLGVSDPIITYSNENIISTNNAHKLYGVYNLNDNRLDIENNYQGIYRANNGNYIAVKDDKAAIIDDKLKKIVDFEYDFIDKHEDFYVVSKNNKLAIMNNNYELVTEFAFDYQDAGMGVDYTYKLCCSAFNTFAAHKIGEKYILTINANELNYDDIEYEKHETYIINSDGTYETITTNHFEYDKESNLIYSYNTKENEYTLYTKELEEKIKINMSDYDYEGAYFLSLINGNTIEVGHNKDLYFDYETGEELDNIKDYTYEFGDVTFKYIGEENEVIITQNEKEIIKYEFEKEYFDSKMIEINEDGTFSSLTEKNYFSVKKQ